MASGIHHITLITRKVQTNVDFYVGFLGLRLVKRTGGFEDAEQLHLVYGDRVGSPGSLITFLVWEDGSLGRIGLSQVAEVALSVDPASIGFWVTRSLQFGLKSSGPTQEFGEPVLRLTDPDGVVIKIVGSVLGAHAPSHHTQGIEPEHAIRRVRGATIYSAVAEQTSAFLQNYFGYRPDKRAGAVQRLVSESGDVVDVREAAGFWPGAPGTGVVDHIAFRTLDLESLAEAERKLASLNSSLTHVHDRKYFVSLYVREPGEALFELATDGPGMTVDESIETLGSVLFVPPSDADQADAIRTRLPQFSMPGEDRIQYLELPFVHRFHVPSDPDGTTLVLMHGTGGNEADLMPFAARLMPRATLLGVRGRSVEEGTLRWFRRLSDTTFDQADIRAEAAAFAAFMEGAIEGYRLVPEKLAFLGYSNGANFLAATMLLHPPLAWYAILLRPSMVLESRPDADLSGCRVLMIEGRDDPYASLLPGLAAVLSARNATVSALTVSAGHELSDGDLHVARTSAKNWLG
jgi:phospholipase/carboxylesterase